MLTQQALSNPLRHGAAPYDDLKDYFGGDGVISEDYSGTGIRTARLRFGDASVSSSALSPLSMA